MISLNDHNFCRFCNGQWSMPDQPNQVFDALLEAEELAEAEREEDMTGTIIDEYVLFLSLLD